MFLFAQIEGKTNANVCISFPCQALFMVIEKPYFLSLMMLTDKAPAMSNTPATIIMSL